MVSVSNPIHDSVQRPRISSLYLLPKRVSTKTNHGLLQSWVLDAKDSSLAFPSLLEKGKHLVPLQVAHSGKALGIFNWIQQLRRRSSVEFPVVAAGDVAADADDDNKIEITVGSVRPSKSFGERFPALVSGFFYVMWYFLNVIFNKFNKKVYKYFPYPYFFSVAHLLLGVGYCLVGWAVGVPKHAPIDKELLTLLTPVAFCHALGHVISNVLLHLTKIVYKNKGNFTILRMYMIFS